MRAVALAHPNIALSKYWGKLPGDSNIPAVPSLSVTLDGLSTLTRVEIDPDLQKDSFSLDGDEKKADVAAERASLLLERVRGASGKRLFARIESKNDFPTASGLASSASGFAALALAAVRAFELDWGADRVSDLARRSSASAARSIYGGFVELQGTVARVVAPPDHLPLRVLICVTTEEKKSFSSTSGMTETAARSPYYAAWLDRAPRMHHELKEALLRRDFEGVGELAEASALAMHASAMAAGIVYWSGVTLEAMRTVTALRKQGTMAFFTIDAGPHVKVLARPEDAALVAAQMRAVPGVLRVIEAKAGMGARLT